jgi:hypothetical protein
LRRAAVNAPGPSEEHPNLRRPEGALVAAGPTRRGCGGGVAFDPTEWYAFSDHGAIVATFENWSPSMNDEEHVPQARTPVAPADAGETPVEKLEALGVRGILWQLARDGQIIDVRCEMPQCYCFRGRRYFEPISPGADWMPTGRPLSETQDARRSPHPRQRPARASALQPT